MSKNLSILYVFGFLNLLTCAILSSPFNDIKIESISIEQGLSQGSVYGIVQDSMGFMWFRTTDGLNRYDGYQFKMYHFKPWPKGSLNSKRIYCLYKDIHDLQWIGTAGELNRYAPDKNIFNHCLIKSSDNIIQNSNYVSKITEQFERPTRSISERENSHQKIISDIIEAGSYMWIGPEDSLKNLWFGIDNGVYIANSTKRNYAYQLMSFEDHWNFTNASVGTAYYARPAPGNFTLRVKGTNHNGLWDEQGIFLNIIILPPWWKTWWIYGIFAVLILVILYGIRRYELRLQQLKHQMELEQVEAEKFQELDQIKSRFFANISHEFRTPLTLIKGQIERWLPNIEEPEMQRDFEIAQRNTHRLLNLVNQLLDISRLESGKMKLEVRPENIVELTRQLTMAFESLARMNDIKLIFTNTEKEIIVYLDREHYEKIITNLLSNAMKFSQAGGVIIVDLEDQNDSQIRNSKFPIDEFVRIRIKDTGIGISSNQLSHIFDRFYQAGNTFAKDTQGSGLGLALTKELVELYHGEIKVCSEVGKGTEFIISLPLGKEHLKPEEILPPLAEDLKPDIPICPEELAREKSEIIKTHKSMFPKDASIALIVEDNPDMRSYLRNMLVSSYNIIEAVNGLDGFVRAAETIPDIIVSDVMMPGMNGFQFCERIKTDERTSHIPVILLTAKSSSESRVEGLETGADDYLTKPFDSAELRVRVKNLIEQRRKLRERFRQEITLEPKEIAITSADANFLQRILDIIEQHIEDTGFGVVELSDEVGMSRSQLHRKLRALTDQSPNEFIRTVRLKRAAALLEKHAGNISEVAYQVGFNNPAYFAECFRKLFGMSPKEYSSHSKN